MKGWNLVHMEHPRESQLCHERIHAEILLLAQVIDFVAGMSSNGMMAFVKTRIKEGSNTKLFEEQNVRVQLKIVVTKEPKRLL